jgi:ATP synthase I chain
LVTRQFTKFPVKISGFAMLDATNTTHIPASTGLDEALNARVLWTMVIATALTVAVAAFVAPWRVTTGLLLGGLLALFSHHWLKNSATAAVQLSATGGRPQWKLAQFVLRYVVIAAAVFAAYTLDLVSLTAVLASMSSFVVAMFVEAIREFYFAIIKREEN